MTTSIAESSPSLISHSQDYGTRIAEETVRVGDFVEVHMRTTRNGTVLNRGVVTEIDVNRPNRAKAHTYPPYFRRVPKISKVLWRL